MNQTLQPKVILITGCSSGFGLLMSARLASRGHRIFATMRDLNKKQPLLNEVEKRGGKVEILMLDVTNKDSIKMVINHIKAKEGCIDMLINNAGYGLGGFFEDLSEEDIRHQMETNFFGVQNVTREVIPLMRERRKGKIINISSIAGLYASPCFSAYNASKWALEGFSESLYHELKFFGINVILVEPGTYKTKIFHENACFAKDFDNSESPYLSISKSLRKKVLNYVDKCHKNPEDVARLVEKLINSSNPPFRNFSDNQGRILVFLRRFLPFRVYSWIYRKILFQGVTLPK